MASPPVITYSEYERLRSHVLATRAEGKARALLAGLAEKYPDHEEKRVAEAVMMGFVSADIYAQAIADAKRRTGVR